MATNGYPPTPAAIARAGGAFEMLTEERVRPRHRYWLHALLLLLTLLTTTAAGAGFARAFAQGRPFDFDTELAGYARMWQDPAYLLDGLC